MKKTLLIIAAILAPIALHAEDTDDAPAKKKGKKSRPPVSAEMLAEFDANKDGKLDKTERKAAGKAKKAEMIAKFDKDGDGVLSPEEKKAAGQARKAAILAKFDADKDGKLNKAERAMAEKEMGPMRKGKKNKKAETPAPAAE